MKTLVENNLLSQLYGSYNAIERLSEQQTTVLTDGFQQNKETLDFAEKHGGFRPRVSIEKDLLKRANKCGLSHYLVPLKQVPDSEYHDALEVGEEKMTSVKPVKFNHSKLIRSAAIVSKMLFDTRKFEPLSIDDSAQFLNMQASAGFPYYRKKGKVLENIVNDSKTIPFSKWRFFPTMRSFRVQFRDSGGQIVPKIRVIYPYPGSITLLELRFVRPVVDYFISNFESPYVTGKTGQFVHDIILRNSSRYNISTDISKFDQNMPNQVIHAAFSCLRTCFRLDDGESTLFEQLAAYFTSSYLSSRVGTSTSKTIVKSSGIPSGTGFTNLIGTICHLILLAYYDHDWFKINSTFICSDDNLSFTDRLYTLVELGRIYRPWNLEYNSSETCIQKGVSKVHFLGFDWLFGIRMINIRLAMNQLVYHTLFIAIESMSPFTRILSRAASILFNGKNGSVYFDKLFPDVDLLKRDLPYHFLPSYQPATSSVLITGRKQTRVVESLKVHYHDGWKLR